MYIVYVCRITHCEDLFGVSEVNVYLEAFKIVSQPSFHIWVDTVDCSMDWKQYSMVFRSKQTLLACQVQP